jgi:DNA-binding transcriptional LysR family regulator
LTKRRQNWISSTINNAYLGDIGHFLSTTALFGRQAVFSYQKHAWIHRSTKLPKHPSHPFPLFTPSQDRRHNLAALFADAFGNVSVARRIALINCLSISLAITVVPSSFF